MIFFKKNILKNYKQLLIIFLLILSFSIPNALFSQNSDSRVQDSTQKEVKNYNTKSPTGAIIRSLILPGWGQVYVENYWKAPIFFGAATGLTYLIFWNDDQYTIKKNLYNKIKSENPNDTELPLVKSSREYYRDNRDKSAFFLVGVYILAAVDSYVGAHLYDFDVSDDLSFQFTPDYYRGAVLSLSFKIK